MLFLLLQVVAHFTLFACQLTAHRPSVTIKNGTVVGLDLPQFSQSLFLGIPYSQPPVDGLRLKPPRSMNSSFGELDATVYGPHCWPAFAPGSDDDSGFNNSEDCLTLNIIRPYGVSVHSPVPVVVWIHGGGFFTGGSADLRYNGTYLVQASIANEQPIVFVSINYRLASLGFSGGELGSNTDEGWSITPTGANSTIDAKASLVGHVPAENTDAILDLYFDVPTLGCPFDTGDFQPNPLQQGPFRAPGVPGLQNKRVAAIVGDVFVAASSRWLAEEISPQVPFWKYRFNHKPYDVSSGIQDFIGHMAEIDVFNTQNNDTDFWKTHRAMATFLGPTAPIADRFLGVYMSRAWASFAATGNPNNANVPTKIHWPKYSESRQNMVWQTQGCATEQDDYREAGMRFIMDNIFFPSG